MRVLIAGGGIGGLTTALCCHYFGHDVAVFEQSPKLSDIGAGIQIPPNAMKVFEKLGLAESVTQNAFRPEAIEARMGESGLSLFNIPLADYAVAKWGSPYLHIHRADYVEALRGGLERRVPKAVELNAEISGYEQNGRGVTLVLRDGRQFDGDVLIGADGIHSAIQGEMLGRAQPQFTGNVAWRATVPIDKLGDLPPNPTACAWMGRGRHAVTYRLRRGQLANFVGVVERSDWQSESWTETGTRAEALADFSGWHPVITRILQEADTFHKWALFDRAPMNKWTEGRVALLGDAAHPMLPFLAQGAAMAVEDAWVLASALSKPGRPVQEALIAYQKARLPRTSRAQAGSRANAKTFHKRSLPARLATYGPMWLAGHLTPKLVHARMNWLYGFDVTQEEV